MSDIKKGISDNPLAAMDGGAGQAIDLGASVDPNGEVSKVSRGSDDGSTSAEVELDPHVAAIVGTDKIGREHLKHILITGAGFFADSYDLFVINLVLVLMKTEYGQTDQQKSMVACTAIWGAVVGQLVFGLLADVIGRKLIFMTTTACMILGSIGSALTFQNDTFNIYQQMAIWRFILGVGCGGEYPLAASITSESVGARLNGPMLASVFSMQSFGQITGCVLVIILLACGVSNEVTWRIALAFGAIPGLAVFWFRKNMHETVHFKDAKRRRTSYWATARIAFKAFWWPFIGTAMTWFLLDIFFYGNSLFNGAITQAMGLSKSAFDTALRSLYIALFALPGYILSIFTINPLGRWNIQLMGFIVVGALYFVLAGAFHPLQQAPAALIVVYGLSFFFKNFGPNATTYVIPGEYYPTEVKGTLHGASAAAGKIGAGIAANTFPAAMTAIGIPNLMYICASLAMLGGFFTFVFVPKYGVDDLKKQQAERMKMFYAEQVKIVDHDIEHHQRAINNLETVRKSVCEATAPGNVTSTTEAVDVDTSRTV